MRAMFPDQNVLWHCEFQMSFTIKKVAYNTHTLLGCSQFVVWSESYVILFFLLTNLPLNQLVELVLKSTRTRVDLSPLRLIAKYKFVPEYKFTWFKLVHFTCATVRMLTLLRYDCYCQLSLLFIFFFRFCKNIFLKSKWAMYNRQKQKTLEEVIYNCTLLF